MTTAQCVLQCGFELVDIVRGAVIRDVPHLVFLFGDGRRGVDADLLFDGGKEL